MKNITFKRGQGHWKVIYKGAEVGVFHDSCNPKRDKLSKIYKTKDWIFSGCDGYNGRGKTRLKAIENCIQDRKRLFSIADVKELNREAGQHFFDRSTMNFFKSTIETGLLKGGYFITGESQRGYASGRKYTARKVDFLNGSIKMLDSFACYTSVEAAKMGIKADRTA